MRSQKADPWPVFGVAAVSAGANIESMRRWVLAALGLVGGPCWWTLARACGPNPPAYWTLTAPVASTERQLLPTDGAFLISGRAWTEVYPDRGAGELSSVLQVSVRDAAGTPVPGSLEPWFGDTIPTVAWRSSVPLPADSLFSVDASITEGAPRPSDATGEASLRAEFGTGSGPASLLRLSGQLNVILEAYDAPLWKDCAMCGGGCVANGSFRGLRARVTIPAVDGGYTPGSYAAWVWMSNDTPHSLPDGPGGTLVNLGGVERVAPNEVTQVFRDVPAEDVPYAPCVSVRVFDPSGHFVDPVPVCLPRQAVNATIDQLDRNAGGGCTIAASNGGPRGRTDWMTVGLGFLMLCPTRRRARASITGPGYSNSPGTPELTPPR